MGRRLRVPDEELVPSWLVVGALEQGAVVQVRPNPRSVRGSVPDLCPGEFSDSGLGLPDGHVDPGRVGDGGRR
eukprot:5679809-Alexandrium_andersonii.AAC.1